MLNRIEIADPLMKVCKNYIQARLNKLGTFQFDKNPKYSYLTLREKDTSDPNSIYYGFWYNNSNVRDPGKQQREYKGVIVYNDGSIYEGHIHENLPNGKGIMIFPDFTYYLGEFSNGKVHRRNDSYSKRRSFKRSLTKNPQNVKVVWTSNGNKYKGGIRNGVPDGYGKFYWENGTNYEGNWSNGNPHGKGKVYYQAGSMYEGDLVNGVIYGKGT